jgi:trimeric autotransporter adhesin
MKKYILLLITTIGFSQVNPTAFNKIKVTGATKNNGATRVVVQDSITKEYHWKLASSLGTTGAVLTTTDQTINGIKTFVSDIYVNNSRIGANSATANNIHGVGIGSSFTTATGNSLFGHRAGSYITTGFDNACFGNLAGYSTTVGNLNTYIGAYAGLNNVTGSNNIFLGGNAGSLLSDGVTNNTNTTNSILIGYNTKPLGNTQVNQIVIGDNASGLGSNTTTIGNSSTTFSNIRGRLLLGSSTDNGTDNLQLTGSMNLATAPTTSASGYDILTRNISTGKVEKILSTGLGDMTLGTAQIVSAIKTYLNGTLGLRNVANTFTSLFTNTNTAARTYTFPDRDMTLAGIDEVMLLSGNQAFTGVKTGSISGTELNSLVLTNASTTTGAAPLSINVSAIGGGNGQRGIYIANNNAGAAAASSQALYIDNNSTGYGIQTKNFSTGYGYYFQNFSSGIGMRLDNSTAATGKPFQYTKQGVEKVFINDAGDLSAQIVIANAPIRMKNYTVATLPTGVQGDNAYVTDALSPTFLATVVGGGSVVCPVFYNGTNWVCR